MTRVSLPIVLLAALVLGGCGSSQPAVAPASAPVAAPVKRSKPHVLRTRTFLRRVNRVCAGGSGLGRVLDVTGSAGRNRAAYDRAHRVVRRVRRDLVRVGVPRRDRARWHRAMSKLLAAERHLDMMRAAAASGSRTMLRLSARELAATARSAQRRLRLFGAPRCAE